jgi:hypothetical protein
LNNTMRISFALMTSLAWVAPASAACVFTGSPSDFVFCMNDEIMGLWQQTDQDKTNAQLERDNLKLEIERVANDVSAIPDFSIDIQKLWDAVNGNLEALNLMGDNTEALWNAVNSNSQSLVDFGGSIDALWQDIGMQSERIQVLEDAPSPPKFYYRPFEFCGNDRPIEIPDSEGAVMCSLIMVDDNDQPGQDGKCEVYEDRGIWMAFNGTRDCAVVACTAACLFAEY